MSFFIRNKLLREKLHLQQKREREIAEVNARYQQMVTPQQMVNNNHPIYNNNNNNQLVLIHPRVNIEEIDD